ncbi:unnamed protein product [Cyclocybe aegerita]|uniref:CHAT domain-containing protein n=1 Tax=Cyclocybe aegerita TaxID=1973307 RepID=A0A8S0VVU4_CYCAE|nr:unnamed protein product [Cyclocybe aegerita]
MILDSIDLSREPGYSFFFHLSATGSVEIFEETTNLHYLNLAIDLLELTLAVDDAGSHHHILTSVSLASAYLQHYLLEKHAPALESALEIFHGAHQSPSILQWTSNFGDTRSIFIIVDVLRLRYDDLGPRSEDLLRGVKAVKSILNSVLPPSDFKYTAFQVLVVSVIFILSQALSRDKWFEALSLLQEALIEGSSSRTSSPDAHDALSAALDCCIPSSSAKTLCILHLADTLDRRGDFPALDRNTYDVQRGWDEEWESALSFLRSKINYSSPSTAVVTNSFQIFELQAESAYRREPGRLNWKPPIGSHKCTFVVAPAFVNTMNASETPDGVLEGHHRFFHHLKALIKPLTDDELDYLIQNPETVQDLLSMSAFFRSSDDTMAYWKRSPGILAYVIMKRDPTHAARVKEAARSMLQVNLQLEPAYTHLSLSIASDVRRYEEDCADTASRLFKEFLRVQQRGTPRHLFAIIELASGYIAEYFASTKRRTTLFVLALELFREATLITGYEPWTVEARKIMVLGRILRFRYRFFEDPDESMETTIALFGNLWDMLPAGPPFTASVLEVVATQTVIYLAQRLPSDRWHAALRLFTIALDLQVFGSMPEEDSFKDIEDVGAAAEDLLNKGHDAGVFLLPSEAMCTIHTSDIIRTIVLDCSRHSGMVHLVLHLYSKSLRIIPLDMGTRRTEKERELLLLAETERAALRSSLLLCVQKASGGEIWCEESAMTIFNYRAVRITRQIRPSSGLSHVCLLRYYPILTRQVYTNDSDGDPSPSSSHHLEGTIEFDPGTPWPDDLLSRSLNALVPDDLRNLPSTVVPGVQDLTVDQIQELFDMPLEARTIKAFMDDADLEIRSTEGDMSRISERIVHHMGEKTYFSAHDVRLEKRVKQLKKLTPDLSRLVPLQALLSRGPERCLELLEASRSFFWSRLLRLRTSFDDLPHELASDLKQVVHALEECTSQTVTSVPKEEVGKQWELETHFARLLNQARKIPGFERLLKPKTPEMLFRAAAEGPVVVLMGMSSMYAALVVRQNGAEAVFLKGLVDGVLEKLVLGLNGATNDTSRVARDVDTERYVRRSRGATPLYETLLASLWQLIVKPVFDFMGLTSTSGSITERQRLWWCPTGRFAFLPVHAAGINFGKANGEYTSKYVVSSYTPTLSALISARLQNASSPPIVKDLKTLILAQPTTNGHQDLPMTLHELELVEKTIPPPSLLHVGNGRISETNINRTVGEAMEHLSQASILHLACHGHQDRIDPLSSGFELQDGRLTIAKLISSQMPHAVLAFLSACESASNDLDVPDEALNLAAAMLYAGFRSVIGTMWTMNDDDGPEVACMIYKELFKSPDDHLDPKVIARALDSAVRNLQAKGVPPSRWATYIHVGI